MFIIRKLWLPLLIFMICVGIGCSLAASRDVEQLSVDSARPASAPIDWSIDRKPPLPSLSTDGQPVAVQLSGYAWCSPGQGGSCTNVEASLASEVATPVAAGSKLLARLPEGVKSIKFVHANEGVAGDSFVAPLEAGVYHYQLQCKWATDQAESTYVFTLEVV